MRIYEILLKVKRPSYNPFSFAGQAVWRSTEPEVGRLGSRPMCTNAHSQGQVDSTADCQRAFALCKWPWSTGRSIARELLLSVNGPGRPGGRPIGQGPVFGRPSDRPLFPTVENLIVGGRPGGRPTAGFPAELDPNGYIFEAYKLGLFWAVFNNFFLERFQASFSYLFKCLFPFVLELKLSYQKESLSRVFSKVISWVFHHKIHLSFLTHIELSIVISIL